MERRTKYVTLIIVQEMPSLNGKGESLFKWLYLWALLVPNALLETFSSSQKSKMFQFVEVVIFYTCIMRLRRTTNISFTFLQFQPQEFTLLQAGCMIKMNFSFELRIIISIDPFFILFFVVEFLYKYEELTRDSEFLSANAINHLDALVLRERERAFRLIITSSFFYQIINFSFSQKKSVQILQHSIIFQSTKYSTFLKIGKCCQKKENSKDLAKWQSLNEIPSLTGHEGALTTVLVNSQFYGQ